MVAFIDEHRNTHGVEPICAVLPIAPSTYFLRKAQQGDPTTRSARAQRDDEVRVAIQQVWDANDAELVGFHNGGARSGKVPHPAAKDG